MSPKEIVIQLKSLVKNTAIYNSGEMLTKAIAFLLIPVYTRFLNPGDYGLISIISTTTYLLLICYGMGLGSAAMRFYYDYKEERQAKEYFGSVLSFLLVSTLAFSVFLERAGYRFSHLLFPSIPFDPYIKIAIWTTFFQCLSPFVFALCRVKEQAFKFVIFSITAFLIEIGLVIYFVVFLKQGAFGKIIATLIANGLIYIISLFILLNYSILSLRFSFSKIWDSLKFGLPLLPHTMAHWALKLSDRFILQKFSTLREVGLYSLGYNLGMILFLFTASFNNAWAPFLFKNAQTMPKKVFAKIGLVYCFTVIFIGLFLSIFSKELLILISTPKYYDAHTVIPFVVAGYVVQGFYLMSVNQLFYLKQTKYLPFATIISALVNIALNFLFVPKYGMMAAAVNTFIAYLILFILIFIYSQKYFPIHYEYGKFFLMILAGIFLYFSAIGSAVICKNIFAVVITKSFVLSLFLLLGFLLFKRDIKLLREHIYPK